MNDMIRSAQSAGSSAARLTVAVPQLQDRSARNPIVRATRSTYQRRSRRGNLPPRVVVASGVASMIIAGCVYAGTELVLELLARPALLAAPTDVVRNLSRLNEVAPTVLLAPAVLAAIAGIVLVLATGRFARRGVPVNDVAARAAEVHPAGAGASSSAPDLASAADAVGTVSTTGSRHRATEIIRPIAGIAPDRFTAQKAIADAMAFDAARPTRQSDHQNHPLEKERTP